MKKSLVLVFGALFLFGMAHAAVTVEAGGKTTKYENGQTVRVNAAEDTVVNYNGVEIFVPAGEVVVIAQSSDGSVLLSGNNMSGVTVNGAAVRSTGRAVVAVSGSTLSVRTGSVSVNNQAVAAGSSVNMSGASASAASAALPVPTVVVSTEMTNNSAATQQQAQNVEETLSPSSPR